MSMKMPRSGGNISPVCQSWHPTLWKAYPVLTRTMSSIWEKNRGTGVTTGGHRTPMGGRWQGSVNTGTGLELSTRWLCHDLPPKIAAPEGAVRVRVLLNSLVSVTDGVTRLQRRDVVCILNL